MNKKTTRPLIFTLILFSAIAIVGTPKIFAENGNENLGTGNKGFGNPTTGVNKNLERKQNFDDLKNTIVEDRKAFVANKCEVLTDNIDKKISQYDDTKANHLGKFEKISTVFSDLITRLETKGYEVTTLKADAKVLEEKIQQYKDDFATFVSSLKSTKDFACGESEGRFMDALQLSKTNLATLRADANDIKDYYKNTIKVDIKTLREQKPISSQE